MESNVMTMSTSRDRAWPFAKLVSKYSVYQEEMLIDYPNDEVTITFAFKKTLGSTRLTRWIFLKKAKKELL